MFLLFVSKIGIMSRTVEQYFCLAEAAFVIKMPFLYFFPRSVSRIMKPISDPQFGNKCIVLPLRDHATSYEICKICFCVYLLIDSAWIFNSGKRCDSTNF